MAAEPYLLVVLRAWVEPETSDLRVRVTRAVGPGIGVTTTQVVGSTEEAHALVWSWLEELRHLSDPGPNRGPGTSSSGQASV